MAKRKPPKAPKVSRNDGRKLEQIVKWVEGAHLPEGFTITQNRPVYDDDGNQIAELDVIVEGYHGTVKVRTLFECRDRPSEGKANGAWIQQLSGRKQSHGFSNVVAVSSTGFSEGAKQESVKLNIPLRTVEELTAEKVAGFLPSFAPLLHNLVDAEDFVVYFAAEGAALGNAGPPVPMTTVTGGQDRVLDLRTNKEFTFGILWNTLVEINSLRLFEGVPYNGDKVNKKVEFSRDELKHFRAFTEKGERLEFIKLEVTGNFYRKPSKLLRTLAVRYLADGSETVVAKWQGDEEHGVKEIMVLLSKFAPDDPRRRALPSPS